MNSDPVLKSLRGGSADRDTRPQVQSPVCKKKKDQGRGEGNGSEGTVPKHTVLRKS